MKALIGFAAAAIAALTAGGITAALPGTPTGADPSEGKATPVRVTAVVDGDTLRVEDLAGRPLGRVRLLGIDAPKSPTRRRPPSVTPARQPTCSRTWRRSAAPSSSSPTVGSPTATDTTGCCATSTTTTST